MSRRPHQGLPLAQKLDGCLTEQAPRVPWHPSAPGVHFVGYLVTLGGTLRLIGRQASRLAQVAA